jgi:hypothetical protein
MQEKVRFFLLGVTRELCTNKITARYRKPPPAGGKHAFAMMVKNIPEKQLDLETIEENLKNNKYESYEQWRADVNKVIEAPIPQADKRTRQYQDLANKYVLDKLLKKWPGLSLAKWADRVIELRRKIKEISEEPPVMIQHHVPTLFNLKAINEMRILSEKEISNFIKAAEMCYSEENHMNMIDIIKEEEPDLQLKTDDIVLDINRLRPTTVSKLQKYMEKTLKDKGLEYPK